MCELPGRQAGPTARRSKGYISDLGKTFFILTFDFLLLLLSFLFLEGGGLSSPPQAPPLDPPLSMTLPKAALYLGNKLFSAGMAYVGLSRVRKVDDLQLC